MLSSRSTAPTDSAASAVLGEETLPALGPSLPAATTNSAPVCAVSVSIASSRGSTSGVFVPPRLMLITRASLSTAAHCMPARIDDSSQKNSHTLPETSVASGATPR